MKDFTTGKPLLIISISMLFNTGCLFSLPTIAGSDPKGQEKRTVRVTTGIEAVQGWETGLVKANPNLARWHWDPIYSYKQGYASIGHGPVRPDTANTVGKQPVPPYKYNVPSSQDSRPNHIPFSKEALKEVQARYSQPIKEKVSSPQLKSDNNAYGQLIDKKTQATLMPQTEMPPTIATYGHTYATKLDTTLKYSHQDASVYGQLLGKQPKPQPGHAKTGKQRSKTHNSG